MIAIDSALVLASAEGAHAGPIFGGQPTALISVFGETVLDRVIDRLEAFGITRIVIDAGAYRRPVESHLERHKRQSVAQVIGGAAERLPGGIQLLVPGHRFLLQLLGDFQGLLRDSLLVFQQRLFLDLVDEPARAGQFLLNDEQFHLLAEKFQRVALLPAQRSGRPFPMSSTASSLTSFRFPLRPRSTQVC